MAADLTLATANAAVQAAPTAQTRLDAVDATPTSRKLVDVYTCADALEAGDKIRVRKVQGGSDILPLESGVIESTTATVLTLKIGVYQVAEDGTIGTVIDDNILLVDTDVAGGTLVAGALRHYRVPDAYQEVWIVAEVVNVTGSTVAAETIDFYTAVNSET